MSSPVAAAVAAHPLPSALPWPARPLDPASWSALLSRVRHQRLAGLLSAAVVDGALPTTAEQAEAVEDLHVDAVCGSLVLETATLRTVALLEAAHVRVRVLKGPAVAHLDYPDPALRLFGDIDVLVHADDFDRGVAAMVAAGNLRRFPQPRPGFDRRFSKGTSFDTPDGLEVDYHRTFVMGPYGLRLRVEDLWTQGRPFALAGTTLTALDDDVRFLHACFHAALGNLVPRLVPQRDVAQMLTAGRVDADRVLALAAAWGAEPVVARAVTTTWATLGLTDGVPLSAWAHRYRVSPHAEGELAVYHEAGTGYARKSLAALRALPRLRDKVAFAYALALPDASYLAGRTTTATRWRRGLTAARRTWGST